MENNLREIHAAEEVGNIEPVQEETGIQIENYAAKYKLNHEYLAKVCVIDGDDAITILPFGDKVRVPREHYRNGNVVLVKILKKKNKKGKKKYRGVVTKLVREWGQVEEDEQ